MLNLIPVFTFILAVCFRMEVLNWRSRSSQAMSLGTVVSVAGAFVMTLYKGPPVISTLSGTVPLHQLLSQQLNWILGAFFLAAEAFLISAIYILQVLVLRKFPAVLLIMFYQFFFNTILYAVFSLIVVTDPSAWKLRLDIELFAIIYSVSSYWYCFASWSGDMVPVKNRTSPCFNVQAPGHYLVCCHVCHLFRGPSLSWKFDWRSYNCCWILCSDVGESSKKKKQSSAVRRCLYCKTRLKREIARLLRYRDLHE